MASNLLVSAAAVVAIGLSGVVLAQAVDQTAGTHSVASPSGTASATALKASGPAHAKARKQRASADGKQHAGGQDSLGEIGTGTGAGGNGKVAGNGGTAGGPGGSK